MAKRSKRKMSPVEISREKTVPGSASVPARSPAIGWKVILQALILILAGLWIYASALQGTWLWDDDILVSGNLELHSWDGLAKIWFAKPVTDYWPVTWTVLWLEWHLWGNHPLGYHLVSLALHIADSFLIWRLLARLGLSWAWLGGLLFVIQPLAVESVAWISEIKNTLSLLFFLLSCDAWLDVDEGRKPGYWRSILYYLAAMLSKTSTVMLPVALLLYQWWKRDRITRRDVVRMIPYFAIAVLMGIVTIFCQNYKLEMGDDPMGGYFTRSIRAGTAVFFYLGKFILPTGLSTIYPRENFDVRSLLHLLTVPLLGVVILGLWVARKGWSRHVLFGLGFFLINLFPVLGFLKMSYLETSWVADHFIYLPMIGLIGLVVAGLKMIDRQLAAWGRPVWMGAIAVWCLLLAWGSHGYAGYYRNLETLWSHAVLHNPGSWKARNNYGIALQQEDRIPEAMEQFEAALKINPNLPQTHANLGNALMQVGQMPEAIEEFRESVRIKPDYAEGYYNIGDALMRTGHAAEAMEQFQQAVQIKPDYAEAHNNLGNALLQTGQAAEATEEFQKAVQIQPDYAEAHNNLGNALLQTGQTADAITQFQQAVQFKPDYAEAYYDLGDALMQAGRMPEAVEQFQQAIKLKPDFTEAHYNMGGALEMSGRTAEAMEQFEQALRIKPDYTDARNNLDRLKAMQSGAPASQ